MCTDQAAAIVSAKTVMLLDVHSLVSARPYAFSCTLTGFSKTVCFQLYTHWFQQDRIFSAVHSLVLAKIILFYLYNFCCRMPLAVQSMVSAKTTFFSCAIFGFGEDRVLLAVQSLVSATKTTTKKPYDFSCTIFSKDRMILAIQSSAKTIRF